MHVSTASRLLIKSAATATNLRGCSLLLFCPRSCIVDAMPVGWSRRIFLFCKEYTKKYTVSGLQGRCICYVLALNCITSGNFFMKPLNPVKILALTKSGFIRIQYTNSNLPGRQLQICDSYIKRGGERDD